MYIHEPNIEQIRPTDPIPLLVTGNICIFVLACRYM